MSQTAKNISTLLSQSLFSEGQHAATDRLYASNATLLIADVGFGKTIVTLTALQELLADGVLKRVLVIAPLEVCKTVWRQEAAKWSHTAGLKIGAAIGPEADRLHVLTNPDFKIVLINFENLVWLCSHKTADFFNFDGLVVDEITKLKSSGGAGFKKLRHKLKFFNWRAGLTATPVSEDFEGLFGQCFILDSGKALGGNKALFLARYFYALDFNGYKWALMDATGGTLLNAVKDMIYITDNAAYSATLPPLVQKTVMVDLPDSAREAYDQMRKNMILEGVTADSAAILAGKLQQLASGFMYVDDHEALTLHGEKIAACKRIMSESHGNIIIAYWYQEDLARLRSAFPDAVELKEGDTSDTIAKWNRGEIKVLLLQPRSAGHGLQLQHGGHTMIFLGPIWSRDLTEQTIGRVHRQGQKYPVSVFTLCAAGTIEGDMMTRVEKKGGLKRLLLAHLG